jgi:peptide/nickel transport system substrate-binding protein
MAAVAVAASLFVVACGNSPSTSKSTSGGVVTFAEGASAPPNYIDPMEPGGYFSVTNISDFNQIMYLPLYWFGDNGEPVFNKTLSIANAPVFSDNNTVANITMKHWVWSNGTPITARDVILWMNLLSAATDPNSPAVGSSSAPGPGYGAAVPGGFPENVVSYKQTGTYTLQFKLNASYNPTWYLYNELSQIYPMPQASWDELSTAGPIGNYDTSAESRVVLTGAKAPASCTATAPCYVPSNPGTGTTGALGVAQVINSQSQDLTTYATNPLWQVVSGQFKLSEFTTSGFVKMVPNKDYSGSPKPSISAFELEPYTTDTAEFDALTGGSLTIGWIPQQDLAQKANLEKTDDYSYASWNQFGFTYFPYNFTNPTTGPIFKQLYFRQAFQSLVNQAEYIKDFSANTYTLTNGPVPTFPAKNPDESPLEAGPLVYPYDPGKAVSLLKDNGWTVNPGGSTVCGKPGTATGDCGAGITANQPLTFKLLYESGVVPLTDEMEALQSAAKQEAGIDLNLSGQPFATVIGTAFDGCTYATPCSNWDLADWGGGWVYSPDYIPTGEELFETGASSNAGDYSNPTNDANIVATNVASSQSVEISSLFKYENYLAKQLPVIWMPTVPYQLTMYKSNLQGLVPQGVYDEVYPADYSFKS